MLKHPLALTALVCLVHAAFPAEPLSPADAVAAAVADARALPPQGRSSVRYLSLHNVPAAQREQVTKVLGFHCNSLSRESDIVLPTRIGTGLLRLYLYDYDWDAKTWDALADPVFVTKIQETVVEVVKTWPGGVWPQDGKYYPANSFTYKVKEKKAGTVQALAPWLPTKEAAELANLTQSPCPIVRADWFVWQTALQADRKPGYYDFLGIKDKKTFDGLVGYDEKLQKTSKRVELLEAVADSTVTLQPRRLGAFPAISGWYWQTFDSRQAVEEKNPLRILNGGFKFDAQEVFGHGPNGLLVWGLFDDKGARQDSAPDFIASDATASGTDRRVHAGVSCVRCHLPNSGINPVDGWARTLFTGAFKLQSPDYEKLKELRQKYLRDLEGPMEDSRRVYTRSIAQSTGGMTPLQLGAAYGQFFAAYDAPVSLERAARDLGFSQEKLTGVLKAALLRTGSIDTVAAAFLGKRQGGIPVLQYHEIVSTLATYAAGYQP